MEAFELDERFGLAVCMLGSWYLVETANGEEQTLTGEGEKKLTYPQEFRLLCADHGAFEHQGWYHDFDLDEPVAEQEAGEVNRPMLVLRKR
jgi:hypothetical protein